MQPPLRCQRASPRMRRAPTAGVWSALGRRDLQHRQLGFLVALAQQREEASPRGRHTCGQQLAPSHRAMAWGRHRQCPRGMPHHSTSCREVVVRTWPAQHEAWGRGGGGGGGGGGGEEAGRSRRRRARPCPCHRRLVRVEIEWEREIPTGERGRNLGEEFGMRSGSPSIYWCARIRMRS